MSLQIVNMKSIATVVAVPVNDIVVEFLHVSRKASCKTNYTHEFMLCLYLNLMTKVYQ